MLISFMPRKLLLLFGQLHIQFMFLKLVMLQLIMPLGMLFLLLLGVLI